MRAADQAAAVAERAGEEQAAELLAALPAAFGADDGVGHLRPVPLQVLQGTQTVCLGELPLRDTHSPWAPIQVPHTGAGWSSSSRLAMLRRYAATGQAS